MSTVLLGLQTSHASVSYSNRLAIPTVSFGWTQDIAAYILRVLLSQSRGFSRKLPALSACIRKAAKTVVIALRRADCLA
jgi:hypothetical protein